MIKSLIFIYQDYIPFIFFTIGSLFLLAGNIIALYTMHFGGAN